MTPLRCLIVPIFYVVFYFEYQPKRHGSVVVLVALFCGDGDETHTSVSKSPNGRDKDNFAANQRILASTWLPVSDSVMESGHLEDR